MPRASFRDTLDAYTSKSAADRLGISPYIVKSRITSGAFPPPTRITSGGVMLFDDGWIEAAQAAMTEAPPQRRRRSTRTPKNSVPRPASVLGFEPGAEGRLPDWATIVRYFEQLSEASDRVTLETLGTTTDGLPLIAVAISAPANLTDSARERNRTLLGRLWNPAYSSIVEQEEAIREARPVGVILATQHSNEIGACLMTLELAHQLAIANDPETREVLDRTLTLLIPSQNPDGVQMVSEWYHRWLGTEYEGSDMPWLYHRYVGHDNNRDWFMLTQAENRLFADLHNREHPQLVFDMHQMQRDGARFMVPPFIDPLDPNQDPLIQQQFAAVGSEIAARLTAAGKAGVVTHAMFDNYSPSLAYGNYHGSVDLLSEAASARYATPVTVREKDLRNDERFQASVRSWNHPLPWKGGRWTLRDIIDYDLIAARAALDHLARHRGQWLRDYLSINQRSVTRAESPYAFVINRDADQHDPGTTAEMLDVLRRGLVTIHEAAQPVTLDGTEYPVGTRVVLLDQPARNFAKTLLEVQEYPNLRAWPEGPPVPPYDIAGHTLPLQMNVRSNAVRTPVSAETRAALHPLYDTSPAPRTITGSGRYGFAISPNSNASILAVNRLLAAGVPVHRATETNRAPIEPGWILVPSSGTSERLLTDLTRTTGLDVVGIDEPLTLSTVRQQRPRVGLYQSWKPAIDEGWCRWVFREYQLPAATLRDNDIRGGGLRDRFDVIVLPHQTAEELLNGNPEKNQYDEPYPPAWVGGLGGVGMDELQRFVEAGGTLVALDGSTEPVIDHFSLPVRNVLQGLERTDFYCPGSLLRVVMDTSHPLGWGMKRETTVLFFNSPAFEVVSSPDQGRTIARYPAGANPNVSGWILGDQHLRAKSALVEVGLGHGRVVLVGFRPQFRAQARGTYKVLFNAILASAQQPDELRLGPERQ